MHSRAFIAVVTLEQLAALDLLIWLRTTERAATLVRTNQSMISRRSRQALQQFGLELRRGENGWTPLGDTRLLQLERRLHQQARLLGREPLRLQVPFWTRRSALRDLPEGWCGNPALAARVCEDPVMLLRQRVIDAALVTPTQLPGDHHDLVVMELYRRPIELTLFPTGADTDAIEAFRRRHPLGALCLRHLPFLPRSCRQRSDHWLLDLWDGDAAPVPPPDLVPLSVAFLIPEMRAAQEQPWLVLPTVGPHPYVERLVVLGDIAADAAVARLQEHLQGLFGSPAPAQADGGGCRSCTAATPSQRTAPLSKS